MAAMLAIDCGNTTTVFGLYQRKKLSAESSFLTQNLGTASECAQALDWFLGRQGISEKEIQAIVIGSVVPHITGNLVEMGRAYCHLEPLVITGRSPLGIKISYDNPQEVGTDRVVGSLAAFKLYGGPCLIVDFGTATTFDVITKSGEYLGGLICPGIQTSATALSRRAAQLFNVEITPPVRIIGRTTEESLKAGLFYGAVAMVEGLVAKIAAELKAKPKVIATGGLADLVAKNTKVIEIVNRSLVLDGLIMAFEIMSKAKE